MTKNRSIPSSTVIPQIPYLDVTKAAEWMRDPGLVVFSDYRGRGPARLGRRTTRSIDRIVSQLTVCKNTQDEAT
jgi:hypothetical protein